MQATTATLTTVLLKKGLRNVWLRGAAVGAGRRAPRGPGFHLALRARALDLATPAAWAFPRAAIEAMPAGAIAVVDAMGVADAGIFGDILCARMAKRGVAALVTSGVLRDVAGVVATGLPVWCAGRRRAAVGRRPAFCRLAGADRLRRRRRDARRLIVADATARWWCRRHSRRRSLERRSRRKSLRAGSCARSRPACRCRDCTRRTRRRGRDYESATANRCGTRADAALFIPAPLL